MTSPWGKVFLGVLAGVATWKSMGPQRKQAIMNFLNQLALEAQQQASERERQQRLALLPAEPTPPLKVGPGDISLTSREHRPMVHLGDAQTRKTRFPPQTKTPTGVLEPWARSQR